MRQPYSTTRPLGVPAHKLWFRDLKIIETEGEPVTYARPQNGYKARGRLEKLWRTRAPQVILSGPAETGKTLAALQYLDSLAWEYPGLQGLIMRKTYNSTVSSALQTYERLVLGPMSLVEKRGGGAPQWYDYPNGSRIWVGGMDNASRVLSSERDVIFVNQAEELTLDEWETLSTRTSGRAGNMPFGQLIGDCNPANSSHWIKKLGDQQKVEFIESRHTDNPVLYDENGNLTERGRMTMRNLDLLTGVRRKRLRDGIWAAAEGMVYEDVYDPDIHLVDRFDIPPEWTRYWVVDFGFTNPFVCQFWAEDGDGRLYRYREIYYTGRLVEDHARQMLEVSKDDPKPADIVCDHDAEGRATLEKHLKMKTVGARKQVKEGIQAVTARMKMQGDGKPRLFLLKDSLVEPDPDLDERKLPMMTEEEVESYLWNQKLGHNEEPIKQHDHGCLVAGTMVETLRGLKPIESILPGDLVMTRKGYRRVVDAGMTQESAKVYQVDLSDGRSLIGTGNHPVYVKGRGFIPIDAIRYNSEVWQSQNSSSIGASNSGAIRTVFAGPLEITTRPVLLTESEALSRYTESFTKTHTGRFLMGTKFITQMATRLTTLLRISNAFPLRSIRRFIRSGKYQKNANSFGGAFLLRLAKPLKHGTDRKKAALGIGELRRSQPPTDLRLRRFASNVALRIKQITLRLRDHDSVPIAARLRLGTHRALITKDDFAPSAADPLSPTATLQQNAAPLYVRGVSALAEPQAVYNLTIEDQPEYFANGILVHNCDAMRYMCMHLEKRAKKLRLYV